MDVLSNVVNGRICMALCTMCNYKLLFVSQANILIESVEDATFNVDTLHSLGWCRAIDLAEFGQVS